MADISNSVGDGGSNAKHDVALIQLMLRVINNAKGAPYLSANYTGTFDAGLKNALAAFQKDQSIPTLPPPGNGAPPAVKAAPPLPAAKAPAEKSGFVQPASMTMTKLNAALPAKYTEIRIIPDTTTVYVPTPESTASASAHDIAVKADLEVTFRMKVAAVVKAMQSRHKIALGVVGPGWRRTFEEQFKQTKTGAGPGESNHNFGRALDVGFLAFKWVQGDGKFTTEGGWLGSAALGPTKSEQLWSARDAIALREQGLFLTNFGGERVHLQSFNDATANNRASLAKLLTTVGTMKWQHRAAYQSDLGLGVQAVDVGTSKQIWSEKSPVTKDAIAKAAHGLDLLALAKNSLFAKFTAVAATAAGPAPAGKAGPAPAKHTVLSAKDITAADVAVIQRALKADFEQADAKWDLWVPVK